MKHSLLYIAAAAMALSSALTSCDEDFAQPPVVLPPVVQIDPATTTPLMDVKTELWKNVSTPATVGLGNDGDSIKFIGRVCSSDSTGNIYKNLIIQAVDPATGKQVGITMGVNMYDIYKYLPVGQEVVVNVTGLDAGGYNGLLQLGKIGDKGISFMDEAVFKAHVSRCNVALPEPSKIAVTEVTLKDLAEAKKTDEGKRQYMSTLVKINDVQFADAGSPFSNNDASTNRVITDKDGNSLIIRTSNRATFASELCPYGTGSVQGILSWYGSDWQLLLVNTNGVTGFDNVAPVAPEANISIYDLKAKYWAGMATPDSIGLNDKGEPWVMKGRVCSSDAAGNVYKNMYIQGTAPDGSQVGITLAANATGIYGTFPYGQEVVVTLSGMYIGGYSGLLQLGGKNDKGMTFLPEAQFKSQIMKVGTADPAAVQITDVTMAELVAAKASPEGLRKYMSTLVRIKDVSFEQPGLPFSETTATTNRTIIDANGNKMIIRTSNYSKFASQKTPAGTGTITGLLSYFGSDWQIILNDAAGVSGFSGSGVTPNPDPTPTPTPDPNPGVSGAGATALATQLSLTGSTTIGGYTVTIAQNTGTTAPALHATTSAIRLYGANTITVAATSGNVKSVKFVLSSDAHFRYGAVGVSSGKFEPAQAKGDTELNWVGDAPSVTFTVDGGAIYGDDGEGAKSQLRFTQLDINGGAAKAARKRK